MAERMQAESREDTGVTGRGLPSRAIVALLLSSLAYLTLVHLLIGLRIEHVVLVFAWLFGLFVHPASRRVMAALTVFLVFGILYDAMKAWPNHLVGDVDIQGIYQLEKQLFGIDTAAGRLTPNEFFLRHNTPALDMVTGLIYLNWVSIPMLFALWLLRVDRRFYLHFGLVFLFVNILGFIVYYLHPAAPPWYVEQYGFAMRTDVSGSAAGLARFDRLVGLEIFQTIYTRNSNVFAAVPSLHSAYPVIVFYYALRRTRSPGAKLFFALFMIGIWFTAVYSNHHYVIDVVIGAALAVTGIALYHALLLKVPVLERSLSRYERLITASTQSPSHSSNG
ncbi:MAG: phosphatase PAP2 family protein [Bacteroidota bacterium]|nr:phosphatase PAP2 family protein [Bacteroidota bacterium]